MEASILVSALMLGIAGAPHCTAMCSAPCAAVVGREGGAGGPIAFHVARITGYAAAGGVAAGGVATLGVLAAAAPVLRPLWALLHAGIFVLGLWLLWQGRQPMLLAQWGRSLQPELAVPGAAGGIGASGAPGAGESASAGWQPLRWAAPRAAGAGHPWRAGLAGSLWFAWPCGLLQSALLVAALSSTAWGGAAAMGLFATTSSAGLVLAPWVWRRLGRAGSARAEAWALRAAGLAMAAMSGWALTSGLWHRFAEYCATL